MKKKIHSLCLSFMAAASGVKSAVRSERNMRIHLSFVAYVVLFGVAGKVRAEHWIVFFLCFSGVLAAELFNTSIEKICDVINEDYDEKIKFIKDVSAAAVFIVAIISALVGLCIFLSPYVFGNIAVLFSEYKWLWLVLVMSLLLTIFFIFRDEK